MKPILIPAILAKSRSEFERKLKLVEGAAPVVHVDVMDGKFVPNKTWADPTQIARIKTKAKFELHLMVNDPLPVVVAWLNVKGLQRVIFHVESPVQIAQAIKMARAERLDVGLAISPETPIRKLLTHLKKIDRALVMGGAPGFSGKPLDSNTIDTVRAIRKKSRSIEIGFDIGVSRHTIPTLVDAGVTHLCAASAIFGTKNPRLEIKRLTKIARLV